MELLRCTKCQATFELQKGNEYGKCPECGIGFLVDSHFAKTGESVLDPDDFFDADYEDPSEFYQPDPNEIVPEYPIDYGSDWKDDDTRICDNPNCGGLCGDVHLDLPEWNLLLSSSDLEEQRFTIRTLTCSTIDAANKMDKIFYNTFRLRPLS